MNVPITLIAYALTNKVVQQTRLYLCIKMMCSGTFKWDKHFESQACEMLNYKSLKSFERNLLWLLQNKWVAYNSTSGVIRVKSTARLCHKLDIVSHTAVWIEKEDLLQFRAFCYASIYTWSIKRKNWYQRQPARNKGRTRKSMSKPIMEMPGAYLSKILKLHTSTISRNKTVAAEIGLIKFNHNFRDTELPEKFHYVMQKTNPEISHQYVIWDDTVQQQLPDTIISTIRLKRNRIRSP